MHNDDPKQTDAPTDAPPTTENLRRFLGPFVRLTQPAAGRTEKAVWVRASAVLFSQEYSGELTRARSHVWLGSLALPIIEEPADVALLVHEAEERANKTQEADERALAEAHKRYAELQAAADDVMSVLDLSDEDEERDHEATVKLLDACADRIIQLQDRAANLSRTQRRLQDGITTLRAALRDIRLAIYAAGRDVQALANVEMILDSVADAVHFCDRHGNPIKGGSHADAQAVQP